MADDPNDGGNADGGDNTNPNPQPDPKAKEEGYYRRKWEKLNGEMEALKKERMTAEERTKAERDEANGRAEKAEASLRSLRIFGALEKAAWRAGAHDLDAVVKLADHSKLQIDDDGSVIGVDGAIKDLQKTRGYLFGPPPRPSTGSGGGRPSSNGGSDKGATARRMDDAIRGKLRS